MKIDIEEIKKIKLDATDVIWVRVPRDNTIPPARFNTKIGGIHQYFKDTFPNNDIIVTSDDYKIDIITKQPFKLDDVML